jgi:hypothetical protein
VQNTWNAAPTVTYSDEDPSSAYYGTVTKEARKPIFSNAIYRASLKGATYTSYWSDVVTTEQTGRISYFLTAGPGLGAGAKSGGITVPYCEYVWTKPN